MFIFGSAQTAKLFSMKPKTLADLKLITFIMCNVHFLINKNGVRIPNGIMQRIFFNYVLLTSFCTFYCTYSLSIYTFIGIINLHQYHLIFNSIFTMQQYKMHNNNDSQWPWAIVGIAGFVLVLFGELLFIKTNIFTAFYTIVVVFIK